MAQNRPWNTPDLGLNPQLWSLLLCDLQRAPSTPQTSVSPSVKWWVGFQEGVVAMSRSTQGLPAGRKEEGMGASSTYQGDRGAFLSASPASLQVWRPPVLLQLRRLPEPPHGDRAVSQGPPTPPG